MTPLPALRPGDRVAVTGASGWLGRSLLARLLPAARATEPAVLALASTSRTVSVGSESITTLPLSDSRAVRAWNPTVLVHAAFVTREHLAEIGEREYTAVNRGIVDAGLAIAELPTIRSVVSVSSGAAVAEHPDFYGRLKAEQESRFAEWAARSGRTLVNARVWSVSGPLCPKPDAFAFTSFVKQAVTSGSIKVEANHPVWRRYVDAGEYMGIALSAAVEGRSIELDSGGVLTELHSLAERIGLLLDVPVDMTEAEPASPTDRYYSDSTVMDEVAADLGIVVSGLDDQIKSTATGMRNH